MSAAQADREVVDQVLRRLDEAGRAIVVLHYFLGMPLPDVAAAIGIPLGTAKSRLHYALAAMKGRTDLVKLAKGEKLELRYGILLHTGDVTAGKVAEHYEYFAKLP